MLSQLSVLMLFIAVILFPIGVLLLLTALFLKLERVQKFSLWLLLIAGIAALASLSLCSLGFGLFKG